MNDGTQAIEFATKQELEEAKEKISEVSASVNKLAGEIAGLRIEDAGIKAEIKKLDVKFDAFITKQTSIVGALVVIAHVAIQLWGGK